MYVISNGDTDLYPTPALSVHMTTKVQHYEQITNGIVEWLENTTRVPYFDAQHWHPSSWNDPAIGPA